MVAPRSDGQSPYLDVAEAAALLKLSPQGVRKWLKTGRLTGVKLGLRLWRVERSSVEAQLPKPTNAPPEPTPFERIAALLPALTAEDRRRIAVAALTGETERGSER